MDPATITIEQYMNPEMFPLTTQPGLAPEQQFMIDAHNFDEFMESESGGALLTPEEKAIGDELKFKDQVRKFLMPMP